jgi:hypothetical protein
VPRWAKVLIWIVVFAAFAAAGAYAASRTDPFPPGVEDPGARDDARGAPAADLNAPWGPVLTIVPPGPTTS